MEAQRKPETYSLTWFFWKKPICFWEEEASFGNNDFPPNLDKHTLQDKNTMHFCWIGPDVLLQAF